MTSVLTQMFQSLFKLFRWFVVVVPWESCLRVRMGKNVQLLSQGVHFVIPYADKIYVQSVRRRVLNLDSRTLTTRDKKTLVLGANLGYAISSIMVLYETLHHAEGTLKQEASAVLAQYVTTHTLDECEPATIGVEVTKLLNFERYGLKDVTFQIDEYVIIPITLRIVSGTSDRYLAGDNLDTSKSNETWTD